MYKKKKYTKECTVISYPAGMDCPECDCSRCYIENFFILEPDLASIKSTQKDINVDADFSHFVCPRCNCEED